MELFNLLSNEVGIAQYGQTYAVELNWIGNLISKLIAVVGSVGIGIILFSVILKLIVLPFDVYQRITMRKQNLKMKENQAKMEKLQKQYANNKEMYNQKVMEMYKENGFSMFSSCLPMILSMVIFIVAINAFNAYAQYANVNNYNTLVNAYDKKIESICADLESAGCTITRHPDDENVYVLNVDEVCEKNADIKAAVDAAVAAATQENPALTETEKADTAATAVKAYFIDQAQTAVVEAYETDVTEKTGFLWIKNIWATDASYKHPVLEYSDFKSELTDRSGCSCNPSVPEQFTQGPYHEDAYNEITAKLSKQKDQANGYYILIVLSIGTILLQQWISMRSQKEQQQFSSVDGQGASQQKMMMVMMTAMFAIFSFMYSSAFSIYMIMSNVLSLVSTLVINKIVDVREAKKEAKALQDKYNKRFPGRVAPGSEGKDKKSK